VVLTAWNEKRGAEAVSVLGTLGLSNVLAHQLDVSDPSSAVRLADFIKESLASLIYWYGRILVLQSVRSIVHTYAGI
jgi:NAD(P)-dependent dehydrogenase (short-subunit alcohol dehydrogenase family)